LNNQSLGLVFFIGQILKISSQATNLNFQIDDGTGLLDIRIWIDSNEFSDHSYVQKKAQQDWLQGVYVRVVGTLRSFGGKRSVVASRMVVIDDFNELTHHFLEVVHRHLRLTKGPVPHITSSRPVNTPIINNNKPQISTNNSSAYAKPNQQQSQDSGLTNLQSEILSLIQEHQGEDNKGVNIFDIIASFQDVSNENEIRQVLSYLTDEGYLYTTMDENHFAATGDDF